jgi:hypothetical protein
MALEIRGIPVLYGEAAERFIKAADDAEKNPHRIPLRMSQEDFRRMEERRKEFLAKHGGTLRNIQFK